MTTERPAAGDPSRTAPPGIVLVGARGYGLHHRATIDRPPPPPRGRGGGGGARRRPGAAPRPRRAGGGGGARPRGV
ncbi:hypothetical protein ACEN85_18800, partial [Curtobacterium sp. CT11-45]|uniref:hypothetical protein n=1 Tax=Curtobacterium sp. CT11-45 TaxID=3243037 RepID=UPI0039AFC5E3